MTQKLRKLLQQITDPELARAFYSAIELDGIDGVEWMDSLVKALADPENEPLTWTSEKPTAPGWYWWRTEKEAAVIRIIEQDGELVEWDGWDSVMLSVKLIPGQFAGPIPEPKETV